MTSHQEEGQLTGKGLPFVSVIVPCRNERAFIGRCLDSILASSYPVDRLEVLVVDGRSDDGTAEILEEYARSAPDMIAVLDNEKRILASAWNIGIRRSRGEVIMALNAHGVFERDYISRCIEYLLTTDAAYVGGVIRTHPRSDTYVGRAIALALSSRFGVGWSHFRVGTAEPMWTDTAAFGGYRREVFDSIGLFNEELTRSQDMDLHIRLRKSGGKILLVPDMACDYFVRSDFLTFLRDYFGNGFWATYPLRYNLRAVYWRHLVPLVFVLSLAVSALLSVFIPPFLWVLASIGALYLATSGLFSLQMAVARGTWRFLPVLPPLFLTLHIAYGAGSIVGLVKALAGVLRTRASRGGGR